ncbi:MAG: response regulator [Candidatus Latescibacteria bacterium]|jgi:DNA-binding response OmpR family regulator|nr:response regulator [Candidatus Latescibacterota bacterium]
MTILVVDDERSIRDIIKRYMEEIGFVVLVASRGEEARQICTDRQLHIDFILLDLNIPDDNSYTLGLQLMDANPDAHLVYMSADRDLYFDQENNVIESADFLEKPFTLIELEDLIRLRSS